MSTLQAGDKVSNYILEERVGTGSFGEVWRAKHHVFGDLVAVKVPTDALYVRNLQREGVAVHGLKHPNVVRVIDLDPYGDPPYLVMEYVDGPSLREAVDRYGNTFPIDSAVAILRGMVSALGAAHANHLVHRDVKPANILLAHPLEQLASISAQAVKVTDFGLGQAGGVTTQSIMQSGSMETSQGRSIAGTLAYMSPEQKTGAELDGRSDLYSCGIVLFEMLTGERPQGLDSPSSIRGDVPAYLDEVFRRAYTRLDRRYRHASEMLDALSPTGASASAVPPPPWVPTAGGETRCPACHNQVERADQFCVHCGRQLVASVPRCQACGGYVRSKDRFCIFCGKDLRVLST